MYNLNFGESHGLWKLWDRKIWDLCNHSLICQFFGFQHQTIHTPIPCFPYCTFVHVLETYSRIFLNSEHHGYFQMIFLYFLKFLKIQLCNCCTFSVVPDVIAQDLGSSRFALQLEFSQRKLPLLYRKHHSDHGVLLLLLTGLCLVGSPDH